ncbi:hypothetical protein GRJ2_000431900 [Grus japonensis]|uniref:Uncharacterized protein n=1 Tax=Grus japonensis TaxID=30415 RepID=A0ABC9W227_GRUJA
MMAEVKGSGAGSSVSAELEVKKLQELSVLLVPDNLPLTVCSPIDQKWSGQGDVSRSLTAKNSLLPGRSALSQVNRCLLVSANPQGQQQQRRAQLQEFPREIWFDTWLPNVLDHLISCLLASEDNT